MSEIHEAVRSRYSRAAKQLDVLRPEASGCCGADAQDCGCAGAYAPEELKGIGLSDAVSLGCGNPPALAELKPGEVVLDLGSGAGIDVLLSARRVSPGGHAYGVDMTEEMLRLANRSRNQAGISNATFLGGSIDNIPLPDASVDVVISNCVINLAEDKGAVIKEAFRVLRPGGRFTVADMVELEPLASALKQRLDAWAGCISGASPSSRFATSRPRPAPARWAALTSGPGNPSCSPVNLPARGGHAEPMFVGFSSAPGRCRPSSHGSCRDRARGASAFGARSSSANSTS